AATVQCDAVKVAGHLENIVVVATTNRTDISKGQCPENSTFGRRYTATALTFQRPGIALIAVTKQGGSLLAVGLQLINIDQLQIQPVRRHDGLTAYADINIVVQALQVDRIAARSTINGIGYSTRCGDIECVIATAAAEILHSGKVHPQSAV